MAQIVFSAPASRALMPGFVWTGCARAAERAGYTVYWQLVADPIGTDLLQGSLHRAGFAAHQGGSTDLLMMLQPERLLGPHPPIAARKILFIEDRGRDAPSYDRPAITRMAGVGTGAVFMTTDGNSGIAAAADLFPLVVDSLVWRRPITPVPKGNAATVAVFHDDPLFRTLPALAGNICTPHMAALTPQAPSPNRRDIRFPDQAQFYAETRRSAGLGPRLAALASGLVVLLPRSEFSAWADAAICCEPAEMPEVIHRLSRYPDAYFEQAARGIAHIARHFGAERFLTLLERQFAR